MNIPAWESDYWETVLDEAQDSQDEVLTELALKHLYPVYPNIEDTALLESENETDVEN